MLLSCVWRSHCFSAVALRAGVCFVGHSMVAHGVACPCPKDACGPVASRCRSMPGLVASLSLSPGENAAPLYASLSTIMTARPTSGRHATLQSDAPRRVLPQCRGCGTRCDERLVAECSAVSTRKSVAVFFASCRSAASLSLPLLYLTCVCPCLPLCFCGMSTEWPVDEGSRADASGLMQIEEWQCGETQS